MEQPYGQQPPTVPPPPGQPAYQQYAVAQPTYAPRRGWRFGRMLRLLVLRFFASLGGLGRALRPHWLLAIFAVILLTLIAVEAGMLVLPTLLQTGSGQSVQRVSAIPPAPAVENYIKGQQAFDAALIWDSFSDDFKNAMRQQGTSRTTLENQIKQEHDSGQRYVKFDYVGGVTTRSGDKFFYLVEIDSPDPQQDGVISYVFTVDPSGKIAEMTQGPAAR